MQEASDGQIPVTMKRFAIFKPGKHTASSGQELSFSEADLAATVRVYDPAKHEAPIVVGHPKDNLPAYGWVSGISFSEGSLEADPKQVDPDFSEMVQAGRFKKRSASFYAPNSPAHPLAGTPDHGTYYLRHVAFLGAAPPAVKGLRDVSFSDSDGCVEFEEDWYIAGTLARLFGNLRDWIISTAGLEKADSLLPKYAIEDLSQHAKDMRPDPNALPSFNEDSDMTPEQIKALQDKLAAAETENAKLKADVAKMSTDFAELQKTQAEAAKAATVAGIKTKVEALVKAGKVTPAEVETLVAFAAAQDDASATFDFAEAADKKVKVTARDLFLRQLDARPVAVDFEERAGRESEPGDPVVAARQKIRDQVSGKADASGK